MVVDPDQRGTGWGRTLLRAAVRHSYRELGAERVWLDVKHDNIRAQRLYDSEGFKLLQDISHLADPQQVAAQGLIVMEHDSSAP